MVRALAAQLQEPDLASSEPMDMPSGCGSSPVTPALETSYLQNMLANQTTDIQELWVWL